MPEPLAGQTTDGPGRREGAGRPATGQRIPKRRAPAERATARHATAAQRRTTNGRGRRFKKLFRRARRPIARLWRRLGRTTRFRMKLLTAMVLVTSPVWALNLVVAFLGHSVIFPLSPFFLRQKLSALGSYARHRPACLVHGHPDTDQLVKRAEARHRLPRGLLAAVVHVESRGFAHRISWAGAMGPGQLMPDTARQLGVDDPFDSAENIDGAGRLLAQHVDRFHDLRLAVAAYNAGPGAVRGHVPRNGQTPAYVSKVMQAYAALRPRPQRQQPTSPRPSPEHRLPTRRGLALAVTDVRDGR